MSDSLISKYPHLRSLLVEEDSDKTSRRRESPRRSLLGAGPGPRKDVKAPAPGERKPPLKAKAVDLFARSKEADQDDWLTFTIQESLSARQQLEQLKIWLVTNKPSEVSRQSGVGWISVKLG